MFRFYRIKIIWDQFYLSSALEPNRGFVLRFASGRFWHTNLQNFYHLVVAREYFPYINKVISNPTGVLTIYLVLLE